MAQGDQCGERDHRAAAAIQSGPGPHCAPSEFGDDLLEVAGEVGGLGARLLDVSVAEPFSAHGHAVVVTTSGHVAPSLYSARDIDDSRYGWSLRHSAVRSCILYP